MSCILIFILLNIYLNVASHCLHFSIHHYVLLSSLIICGSSFNGIIRTDPLCFIKAGSMLSYVSTSCHLDTTHLSISCLAMCNTIPNNSLYLGHSVAPVGYHLVIVCVLINLFSIGTSGEHAGATFSGCRVRAPQGANSYSLPSGLKLPTCHHYSTWST